MERKETQTDLLLILLYRIGIMLLLLVVSPCDVSSQESRVDEGLGTQVALPLRYGHF